MSERRRWAGAAGAAAAIAACATIAAIATACGGASSNGVASETPTQLLAACTSAVKNAGSYEVSSTGSFGDGVTSFDFKVVGADLSGTFVKDGNTVTVIDVGGNIYLKAPAAFYTGAGVGAIKAAVLASVWVEATAGSTVAGDFSVLSTFTDISSELSDAGTVTSGGTGTVDGQPVAILKGAGGTTLDVASTGPAYPVQVTLTGASAGVFNLSNWNSVPSFTAPPSPLTLPSS
jgi:hypothetical protein